MATENFNPNTDPKLKKSNLALDPDLQQNDIKRDVDLEKKTNRQSDFNSNLENDII